MSYFHYTVSDIHLGKNIEWYLKLEHHGGIAPSITCPSCQGSGKYTGFGCWDEDQECSRCHGSRMISNPEYKSDPKPPQWLVDRLSKVMKDAWNQRQNEEFQLIPSPRK